MGTALITGASAGLGTELARLFAKDGHSLILVARRRDLLETVATELRSLSSKITVDVIDMDLGVAGAGAALFQRVESLGRPVEFLINNAGFGSNGSFQSLPLSRELQMIDLNVRTLVELTHLFLPAMIKRRAGRILNVGSTAGFQPGPYMATYYASKAFVNSFSEALHEELHGTGVTCTLLAPGATETEFAKAAGLEKTRLFAGGLVATSAPVAAQGYRGLWAGKATVITGLLNQIFVQSLRVSPRFLVRKIAGKLNRP